MQLFAFGEGDLDFGIAMAQKDFGGHAGKTPTLKGIAKLIDFLAVQEEFAVAQMVDVINRAFFVGGDVHIGDKGFAIADIDISVADARVASPQALDFRAR